MKDSFLKLVKPKQKKIKFCIFCTILYNREFRRKCKNLLYRNLIVIGGKITHENFK